jgi:TPR repeat protein
MIEKLADANHSDALYWLGWMYYSGSEYIKKDVDKAAKLFHSAAELGCTRAYNSLGTIYHKGEGVNKDEIKAKQYCEKAAMRGNSSSRINLSSMDANAGRFDRAIKHLLIAASQGDVIAVNYMKKAMVAGDATKEHYAQALRGYKQAVDEIKSEQRDKAALQFGKYF